MLEWPLENASPNLAHRYEYYTLAHGKPIVNSAVSAPPPRYAELIAALRSFPSTGVTRLLRDIGVRYVVVNRWEIGTWGDLATRLEAAPGLRLIGTYDDGRHLLYAVLENQPAAPDPLAVLTPTSRGVRLNLHLAGPLWLDAPDALYRGDHDRELELHYADGRVSHPRLALPPLLLPGEHRWNLPAEAVGAVELRIGAYSLPLSTLTSVPDSDQGANMAVGPLPAHLAPGDTLPCLAQTNLPARSDLVLAAALVDGSWNMVAKEDHFLRSGVSPLSCNLTLPTDLPAGEYFLAIGLYDAAAGAFVPLRGADGIQNPGFWRISQPIMIHRYSVNS